MEMLVELGFHALFGAYLNRHPGVEMVCAMMICLMALAWTVLIWWEKRNPLCRIRMATGQRIETESELTSLNTWMKVQDEEERIRANAH
jgi:hypothetical protein